MTLYHKVPALLFCISTLGQPAFATGIEELAPPSFSYGGNPAVAVDFRNVELYLTLDPAGKSIGRATIEFEALETGFPIFDLVPNIRSVRLNGKSVAPTDVPVVSPPGQTTQFRVLKSAVVGGSTNVMDIEYDVSYGDISNGRARVAFLMSDLASSGREFWEQYGPANYEFDQFPMTLHLEVKNSQVDHEVFANGAISENSKNSWTIVFPAYFTTSSFYLHISERGRFKVERATFNGLNGAIPITAYSLIADLSRRAIPATLKVMAELESTYGAYAHDSMVLYLTEGGGGMEHVGSTVTSLWALEHEVTHSWFARGVMPANGNAGWIDEAVASWRDDGYIRASSSPNRAAVNLGGFSPYRRHTSRDAYTLGNKLIGEFDLMFKDVRNAKFSGMRFILGEFFQEFARKTISVENFKGFLENISGRNLDAVFSKYVYGKTVNFETPDLIQRPQLTVGHSKHPRPFTAEERALLH